MAIPAHQQDKINSVQELFHQLDEEIIRFKAATSLGCVGGCGRCCESPAVFATVIEVMPLAYELWKKGQAVAAREKINTDRKGWCIFYQQDPLNPGKGRCGVYPWRPLICRLFGFSAKQDKYAKPNLVTCATIKSHCAPAYEATTRSLADGTLQAPMMQEYAMKVFNIDPSLGQEQIPLNHAVAMAIEKIEMFMRDE